MKINRKVKDIQDALSQIQGNQGVDLGEEAMVMVEVEVMEEDMMAIIKVIAEVEVVSETEVGEEVMVEVITIKPKIKIREIIKPKVSTIKLKIKNKQMVVIMQSSPLVIITQGQIRGPFCFHCERNGADFNHWPYQCGWLKIILDDWHANLNATGHQNQSQNLND